MELDLHGLHLTTTPFTWFYHYPGSRRSTIKASNLYSDSRHNHVDATHSIIRTPCLFQARCSITRDLRPRNGVRLALLQISRKSSRHEASFHFRISPRRRWTDRTHQPDIGTISPRILQLSTGQLVRTPCACGVHIQQCSECYYRNIPVLRQQRISSEHYGTPRARSLLCTS